MQRNKLLKNLADLTLSVQAGNMPQKETSKKASKNKVKQQCTELTVPISKQGERLNKYLARLGICSRREADTWISQGRLQINGEIADLGTKVSVNDEILLDGKTLPEKKQKAIYIALNKPRGIVCTTDLREKNNIISYLNLEERIFPIGRLDKDSSGLILLTNDGSIVNTILRERYGHSKEYEVEVDKSLTADFIKHMQSGVRILGQITKPCQIHQLSDNKFRIILTQGLNRQIRRMCQVLGYEVKTLVRLRIMSITLGNLAVGEYRYLTIKEISALKQTLKAAEKGELNA